MQSNTLVKSRRSTRRETRNRSSWTNEEEDLLIELKEQGLAWSDIYRRFTEAFPEQGRRVGTLQVHYCTKLKERQESGGN